MRQAIGEFQGILVLKVCLCVKPFQECRFEGLLVRQAIMGFYFSGFACASDYWGILLCRVRLCVKLLEDSSFQALY